MEKPLIPSDNKTFFAGYGIRLAASGLAIFAFWLVSSRLLYTEPELPLYVNRGELLFHAFKDASISYSMPFFGFILSLLDHLSFNDPALLGRVLSLLLYLAGYALGAMNGGAARGLAFLLAPLFLDFTYRLHNIEQGLYTLLLVLYVNFQTRRDGDYRLFYSFMAGLSLGLTLLVRSPLFLFPFVVLLLDLSGRDRGRKKYLLNSAVFLVSAYILLVPWAGLNYSLSGRFSPLEGERSSCNIVTGALGTVSTMQGDARALAGLPKTGPLLPWAAKTVMADPLNYAGAVLKRLWLVFSMFPVLIPLAIIGLALDPRKENYMLAGLAAYFIVLHCLLSIERRYFDPLRYLLGFLAVSGLWRAASKAGFASHDTGFAGPRSASAGVLTYALFSAALIPAGLMEYYISVYPARSAIPAIALDRELKDFPKDPWLLKKQGLTWLGMNRTEDAMAVFEKALEMPGGGDAFLAYIVGTVKSPVPPRAPPEGRDVLAAIKLGMFEPRHRYVPEGRLEVLAVKTLKELELNDIKSARADFCALYEAWRGTRTLLRKARTEKDFALLEKIRSANRDFWDKDLYDAALYWPVPKRALILSRLAAFTALTPKLEWLKQGEPGLPGQKNREKTEPLSDNASGFTEPIRACPDLSKNGPPRPEKFN